ncbi:metallophosphoesterase domain-containing 1 [Brachionus plicatilis]|uniref:Metallophosphoesterase domain-containing 1 n=1 Tax=Brachionus plicatilis TaxID=10195 RepID=A0A3M7P8D1_BRAPC|nr:metallophosphoesterase domain-containing 1 [Brachionus plicatilis]
MTTKSDALEIQVNKNTNNPDQAWNVLSRKIKKTSCNHLPLDLPIYPDKVRFVCISDTHNSIERMKYEIPSGDILLHAGDFTMNGSLKDVEKFSKNLENLQSKFSYIVLIAGNHELSFDKNCDRNTVTQDPKIYLKNFLYLEDNLIELFGIKIYGSPWQPKFGNWAFNLNRGEEILKKWNKIPNECDVLITHGPPLGFGDIINGGYHVGCCELLSTIRERVKPKYHIFGHIHEDPGVWTDEQTTFINASTCNLRYKPANPPIIFDIPLPEGHEKINTNKNYLFSK